MFPTVKCCAKHITVPKEINNYKRLPRYMAGAFFVACFIGCRLSYIPEPWQARSPKHRKKLIFRQDRNLKLLGFAQLGAGAFAGDDVAGLF